VIESIFKAFRAARGIQNGNPLATLQQKLAENAADLIQFDFVGLKELVGMIQSLENPRKDDEDGETNESRLQRFLRGEAVDPPATAPPKGAIQ
jgi:hypothetical protein